MSKDYSQINADRKARRETRRLLRLQNEPLGKALKRSRRKILRAKRQEIRKMNSEIRHVGVEIYKRMKEQREKKAIAAE